MTAVATYHSTPSSSPSSSAYPFPPAPRIPYENHPRRPSSSNSHTSLLGPVLEDDTDQSCSIRPGRKILRPSSSVSMSRGSSVEDMAEWVLDMMAVQGGKARWAERERVVLVLGDCSTDLLEPLTSNPAFSNTLILAPCNAPSSPTHPSFEVLASEDLQDAVNEATSLSAAYRKKNKKKYRSAHASASASPFDAILHFLPSPLYFDPTMALQRMLREAIMATTVALASLASFRHNTQPSKGKSAPAHDMPIPLIHIIPSGSPSALPVVVERYLLQLLPSLSGSASSRTIRPLVLSSSAWSTRSIPFSPSAPAIDALLFGGLDPASTPKVALASWDRVLPTSAASSPTAPSWDSALDVNTDRRDSSTSTSTLGSSSSLHGPITPQNASYADMSETIRRSSQHMPSRLSYVETFEDEGTQGEQAGGGTIGKKGGKGVFGWMKRKA